MSDDLLQPDEAEDTDEHLAADAGLDDEGPVSDEDDGPSGGEHLGAMPPD